MQILESLTCIMLCVFFGGFIGLMFDVERKLDDIKSLIKI